MATSLEKTMLVTYEIWLVRINAAKRKAEGEDGRNDAKCEIGKKVGLLLEC
jgi:hypothetical protein